MDLTKYNELLRKMLAGDSSVISELSELQPKILAWKQDQRKNADAKKVEANKAEANKAEANKAEEKRHEVKKAKHKQGEARPIEAVEEKKD